MQSMCLLKKEYGEHDPLFQTHGMSNFELKTGVLEQICRMSALSPLDRQRLRKTQLQGRGVITKLLDPSCDAEHVSTNIGIRRT